ncbi:DUF1054 family protein [Liquorilactobacillus mali]|uniref:Uncharacterized protein n=1 Tax=Liquorilactobacillus mali KCTC 3596 = DSM 20444 TaxID=1046596 RepID=J0KWB5_9LACO|nr:DUF1054 family protein [Liquorilactobacillus mali]EJE97426.1 hypothetical protein LMA_10100 [Liquorilactobacillus mali KCTC 3596 = DSM 20444]KRN11404.1 hypothetical protein FD00_GL000810 [Liquorilactobacillus mali KCTC 3596 = DSM 20444]MDC7953090.1 DUF1054 family protein [Liquorilactobacillus mali]MDV7757316.1 DUF1054 family protein [Liquorilactobacillus mali]QFQ75261.1 DUF1054 family protein [Liquorilactobacillus mali]
MISEDVFDVFLVQGLDERMQAIRETVQPEFKLLGDKLVPFFESKCCKVFYEHVAQHRRRTKYAPEITWCAFSQQQRGYKMEPHFQVAVNKDYLALWLSFIDNPKGEEKMAAAFIENPEKIVAIPTDFDVSLDHTKTKSEKIENTDMIEALKRWKNVKKGEFQIGKIFPKEYFSKHSSEEFLTEIYDVFERLIPIYQTAMSIVEF